MKLAAVAILTLFAGAASCQTITVRLLNAKSGKPIQNQNVTLDWLPGMIPPSIVMTGKDGTGHILIPLGVTSFFITEGPKKGRDPYGIAYFDCNKHVTQVIRTADVLNNGVVPQNACSSRTINARPGEFIFWALTIPWWQPDFQ